LRWFWFVRGCSGSNLVAKSSSKTTPLRTFQLGNEGRPHRLPKMSRVRRVGCLRTQVLEIYVPCLTAGVGAKSEEIFCYQQNLRRDSRKTRNSLILWLRGVDLNHRPLGYEFNGSFVLVLSVRKHQQLSNSWFRLFRVVLDWHVSNLLAIADRFANAKVPSTSTHFRPKHSSEVCR
jgi:hypothetical protein